MFTSLYHKMTSLQRLVLMLSIAYSYSSAFSDHLVHYRCPEVTFTDEVVVTAASWRLNGSELSDDEKRLLNIMTNFNVMEGFGTFSWSNPSAFHNGSIIQCRVFYSNGGYHDFDPHVLVVDDCLFGVSSLSLQAQDGEVISTWTTPAKCIGKVTFCVFLTNISEDVVLSRCELNDTSLVLPSDVIACDTHNITVSVMFKQQLGINISMPVTLNNTRIISTYPQSIGEDIYMLSTYGAPICSSECWDNNVDVTIPSRVMGSMHSRIEFNLTKRRHYNITCRIQSSVNTLEFQSVYNTFDIQGLDISNGSSLVVNYKDNFPSPEGTFVRLLFLNSNKEVDVDKSYFFVLSRNASNGFMIPHQVTTSEYEVQAYDTDRRSGVLFPGENHPAVVKRVYINQPAMFKDPAAKTPQCKVAHEGKNTSVTCVCGDDLDITGFQVVLDSGNLSLVASPTRSCAESFSFESNIDHHVMVLFIKKGQDVMVGFRVSNPANKTHPHVSDDVISAVAIVAILVVAAVVAAVVAIIAIVTGCKRIKHFDPETSATELQQTSQVTADKDESNELVLHKRTRSNGSLALGREISLSEGNVPSEQNKLFTGNVTIENSEHMPSSAQATEQDLSQSTCIVPERPAKDALHVGKPESSGDPAVYNKPAQPTCLKCIGQSSLITPSFEPPEKHKSNN